MIRVLELFRYISFKFVSGLLFSFTLVYFYSSEHIVDNFYLIILQEFFFSFFLTYYRVRVVAKSKAFNPYGLWVLSIVVAFATIMAASRLSDIIFLLLSSSIYPIYLLFASYLEKEDFTTAINIENKSALGAAMFFFVVSWILSSMNIEWIGLVYSRYFVRFAIVILYCTMALGFHRRMKQISQFVRLSLHDFYPLWIILLLMIFKFVVVTKGVLAVSRPGIEVKIFLFLYDFIAAIYGFYLRLIVSRAKYILGLRKERLLIYVFLLFSVVLALIFLLASHIIPRQVAFTLFPSFVIGASFGIFVLHDSRLVSLMYAAVLVFSTVSTYFFGLEISTIIFFLGIVVVVLYLDYWLRSTKRRKPKNHAML